MSRAPGSMPRFVFFATGGNERRSGVYNIQRVCVPGISMLDTYGDAAGRRTTCDPRAFTISSPGQEPPGVERRASSCRRC
jgi:hypothetical protein